MAKASRLHQHANQLLLAALTNTESLAALSIPDWDLLLRVARRVRLLGRLEADLAEAGLLSQIPPKAADHLRATRQVIEHRKTLVTWEINRILWATKGLEAPIVLLKGCAYLMASLPPAPGRLFADVDLMIPEGQIEQVEERLAAKGWMKLDIDPYDNRFYRVWMHEIPPLRHRERGTEIDLHHRILPRTSRLQPDPALMFADARPLPESRLLVLSPPDMVFHALVHLFMEAEPNEGLRFRDLLDVHLLLTHYGQQPGFWQDLIPRACQLGLTRPLYYGLRHIQVFFGTTIPQTVLTEMARHQPTWAVRVLMNWLIPQALLPGHPDYPNRLAALARWLLYIRSHWLKMPPLLLFRHLSYKAYLRWRGINRKAADLANLDLRQQ